MTGCNEKRLNTMIRLSDEDWVKTRGHILVLPSYVSPRVCPTLFLALIIKLHTCMQQSSTPLMYLLCS